MRNLAEIYSDAVEDKLTNLPTDESAPVFFKDPANLRCIRLRSIMVNSLSIQHLKNLIKHFKYLDLIMSMVLGKKIISYQSLWREQKGRYKFKGLVKH